MKSALVMLGIFLGAGVCACGSTSSKPEPEPVESVPTNYAGICQDWSVTCNVKPNPANLVGNYTGQGQTTLTTNEMWSVGDMQTFTAQISAQTANTLTGSMDLGSLHFDVPSAEVRGDANAFSIYGTGSAQQNACSFEAQVIISGTTASNGSQLSGDLALRLTSNIQGSGCTANQITQYPGTGATFSYSATKTP